jgi:hypothetical protein
VRDHPIAILGLEAGRAVLVHDLDAVIAVRGRPAVGDVLHAELHAKVLLPRHASCSELANSGPR